MNNIAPKKQAHALKEYLKSKNIQFQLGFAYEAIAKINGHENWDTYSAKYRTENNNISRRGGANKLVQKDIIPEISITESQDGLIGYGLFYQKECKSNCLGGVKGIKKPVNQNAEIMHITVPRGAIAEDRKFISNIMFVENILSRIKKTRLDCFVEIESYPHEVHEISLLHIDDYGHLEEVDDDDFVMSQLYWDASKKKILYMEFKPCDLHVIPAGVNTEYFGSIKDPSVVYEEILSEVSNDRIEKAMPYVQDLLRVVIESAVEENTQQKG